MMSSKKKRILILGAGVMQGPAIRSAKAMGLETVVIDGDPNAPLACEADRFEIIDLKDIHIIEEFAKKLQVEGGLDGVMTAGTDFSASVAFVAERLGLPGLPYKTALDASDKERMRGCFRKAGLPSPAFTVFTKNDGKTPDNSQSLPFSFPAVVKPVDNMGARGCRRVNNNAELREAITTALQFSRAEKAIAEEYMEGPEFSVDAVVYRGEVTICGLADRHIYFPPYFIEMGHTMPTNFPQKEQDAIIDVFTRGIKALGIENGAAKGDIKLTSRGPMIGEIAARLSGGYMSGWTYPYASGVNPAEGAIAVALGQKPENLTPVVNYTSAERAFISIPGLVKSVEGAEDARNRPFVKNLFLRTGPDQRISFPENNVSKAGNVISAAPDRQTAVRAAEDAVKTVLIRLTAPDEATEAFLTANSEFPPSAYTLDSTLLKYLNQIPVSEKFISQRHRDTEVHSDNQNSASSFVPPCLREIKYKKKVSIIPFPAFMESDLVDYMGRSPRETLEAVKKLTGLEFTEVPSKSGSQGPVLGREFWAALVRGGYQGAVYYIDSQFCRNYKKVYES